MFPIRRQVMWGPRNGGLREGGRGGHYATAAWIEIQAPALQFLPSQGIRATRVFWSTGILVYWISGNPEFSLPKISTVLMFQVAGTVQCTHGIIKYSVWSIKRFKNQILFKCMLWKFLIKSSLFKSFIFLSGGIASQWELTLPPNLIVWRRKNLFNCPLSKSWLFKLIFLARQRLFTLPFVIKVPTILYIKAKSMFKTFLRFNLFHLKLSSGKSISVFQN